MIFYKRMIGDIQAKTGHLTLAEFGAYDRLLDHYYSTERGLPADRVHGIARAVSKEDRKAVEFVLAEFFTLGEDGLYRQGKTEEMIADAQPKIAAARTNGLKGGRPKKDKKETKEKPNRFLNGNPEETQEGDFSKASQSQSQSIGIPAFVAKDKNGSNRHRDDERPNSPGEWSEVFSDEFGVDVDHRSIHDRKKFWPIATAWATAGVTVGQMRAACAKAQADATEPIAWLPAYVDRVLASMQAAKATTAEPEWRTQERERMQIAAPRLAAKGPKNPETFDVETRNVTPIALD